MKTFKQYNERAQMIKDVELLKTNSYDEAEQIMIQLQQQGLAKELGNGAFSVVFGGSVGNLVVKLTDSDTDGAYDWLSIAKTRFSPSSPHYPRLFFDTPKKFTEKSSYGGYGYIAVMEKLDFNIRNVYNAWRVNDWYEGEFNTGNFYNRLSLAMNTLVFQFIESKKGESPERNDYLNFFEIFPSMKEPFNAIYDIAEDNGNWDLNNPYNVASRKGIPVITDPISDKI